MFQSWFKWSSAEVLWPLITVIESRKVENSETRDWRFYRYWLIILNLLLSTTARPYRHRLNVVPSTMTWLKSHEGWRLIQCHFVSAELRDCVLRTGSLITRTGAKYFSRVCVKTVSSGIQDKILCFSFIEVTLTNRGSRVNKSNKRKAKQQLNYTSMPYVLSRYGDVSRIWIGRCQQVWRQRCQTSTVDTDQY